MKKLTKSIFANNKKLFSNQIRFVRVSNTFVLAFLTFNNNQIRLNWLQRMQRGMRRRYRKHSKEMLPKPLQILMDGMKL